MRLRDRPGNSGTAIANVVYMKRIAPIGQLLSRAVYQAARGVAYAGLGSRPALSIARFCGVKKATVFMFHRFSDGGVGTGTDVTMLRQMLATLRRQGIAFMRLRDLMEHVEDKRELSGPTAVFTVDDGYADFEYLAAPIFDGFDAQPSVFLVTDFISARQWCWWDRVTESFAQTKMREIVLSCGLQHFRYTMGHPLERQANARAFIEELKHVPDAQRVHALEMMGEWLDVGLAASPPPAYSALKWDTIRRLEQAGVDFAPHTMTHPMLSRVTDAQVRAEVGGSWDALRRELKDPTPVFSYPNGSPDSFGKREIDIVRATGLAGAVAFRRRYIDPQECRADDRFSLSRFDAPTSVSAASFLASGLAWDQD